MLMARGSGLEPWRHELRLTLVKATPGNPLLGVSCYTSCKTTGYLPVCEVHGKVMRTVEPELCSRMMESWGEAGSLVVKSAPSGGRWI